MQTSVIAKTIYTVVLACVAASAAAESRKQPDIGSCSADAVCTAADVKDASLDALRSNGNFLSISCPYTPRLDERYRAQCLNLLKDAVQRLGRWPEQLTPPRMADIKIERRQTCLDTFIPGREAADCEFYYLEAVVPLSWSE
jgi:hypothetical protein